MEGHLERLILKLEDLKEKLGGKVDRAVQHATKIVEEGAQIVHHDIPSNSKMLPYPVGHCPLSCQPLYPPPSIERPLQTGLGEVAKEVAKCLFKKIRAAKARPVNELAEFPKSGLEARPRDEDRVPEAAIETSQR